MPGQLHDTVTPAPRRSDHGQVRLGHRDIDGLILCAEHYGAPYDLLAAALGAQPARLRGDHRAVAAGRVRRHRAAGTRPGLVLADPGRDDRRRARLPRHAARRWRGWRTSAPCWPPGCGSRPPRPGPGPGLVALRAAPARRPPGPAPAPGTCPTPRSTGPALDASPYAGQVWAVEVELTPKSLARTTGSWAALPAPARYAQVIYLTAPPARPVVTRAAAGLPPASRPGS